MANSPIHQGLKLKRVLGFTSNNRNSFLVHPTNGHLVYLAGCVVVILEPRARNQKYLFTRQCQHQLTSLTISEDGRLFAAASCGDKSGPSIHLWDFDELRNVGELTDNNPKMDHLDVSCMSISPNNRFLASFGYQSEPVLTLWDLGHRAVLTRVLTGSRVRAMSFGANSGYFVTVSEYQVKFWHLQADTNESELMKANSFDEDQQKRQKNYKTVVDISKTIFSLVGRSASLGEQATDFCDVRCGRGVMSDATYCLTRSGLLCELNSKRLLHKWVDLRTSQASCLALRGHTLVVGCSNGTTRCFSSTELRFLRNLPRPHQLGLDSSSSSSTGASPNKNESNGLVTSYPSAIAVGVGDLDDQSEVKIANPNGQQNLLIGCIYNDRSIYCWTVSLASSGHSAPIQQPSRLYSALFHSSCIWGIDLLSDDAQIETEVANTTQTSRPLPPPHPVLPIGGFVTCSADDTVRVWSSQLLNDQLGRYMENESLKRIIYADPDRRHLCDPSSDSGGSQDDSQGLRCVKLSPDGCHLAVGSRSGEIKIFHFGDPSELADIGIPNGSNQDQSLLKTIAAHDAEVLCLEYSKPSQFAGYLYLASSSRDKLIHLFDARNDYAFLQTIDDHSSSITALRFLNNKCREPAALQLISCGADQRIVFRAATKTADGQLVFGPASDIVETKATLYDLQLDLDSGCLLAACQDRQVRLFHLGQVRRQSMFLAGSATSGRNQHQPTIIKIALDPSATFLATSCTDKSVGVFDYQRAECISSTNLAGRAGQTVSDLITDLRFSSDGRHLLACSGNGCLYVFQSPQEVLANQRRLDDQSAVGQMTTMNNQEEQQVIDRGQKDSVLAAANDSLMMQTLPEWARQEMLGELERQRQSSVQPPEVGVSHATLARDFTVRHAQEQRQLAATGEPTMGRTGHTGNGGSYVRTMAQLFKSRENLDKISSHERMLREGLLLAQPSQASTSGSGTPNSSVGASSDHQTIDSQTNNSLNHHQQVDPSQRRSGGLRRTGNEMYEINNINHLSIGLGSGRHSRSQLASGGRPSGRSESIARLAGLDATSGHSSGPSDSLDARHSRSKSLLRLRDISVERGGSSTGSGRNQQPEPSLDELLQLEPGRTEVTESLARAAADQLVKLSKLCTQLHQRARNGNPNGRARQVLARGIQSSLDLLSISCHQMIATSDAKMSGTKTMQRSTPRRTDSDFGPKSLSTVGRPSRRKSAARDPPTPALRTARSRNDFEMEGEQHESESMVSLGSHEKSNRLNMDQMLEAYSGRLFRIVQDKMGGLAGGQSDNRVGEMTNKPEETSSPRQRLSRQSRNYVN